jgi:hypothetical protein
MMTKKVVITMYNTTSYGTEDSFAGVDYSSGDSGGGEVIINLSRGGSLHTSESCAMLLRDALCEMIFASEENST